MPIAQVIAPYKGELVLNIPQYNMLIDRGVITFRATGGNALAMSPDAIIQIVTFERVPIEDGIGVRVASGDPTQLSASIYVPAE